MLTLHALIEAKNAQAKSSKAKSNMQKTTKRSKALKTTAIKMLNSKGCFAIYSRSLEGCGCGPHGLHFADVREIVTASLAAALTHVGRPAAQMRNPSQDSGHIPQHGHAHPRHAHTAVLSIPAHKHNDDVLHIKLQEPRDHGFELRKFVDKAPADKFEVLSRLQKLSTWPRVADAPLGKDLGSR